MTKTTIVTSFLNIAYTHQNLHEFMTLATDVLVCRLLIFGNIHEFKCWSVEGQGKLKEGWTNLVRDGKNVKEVNDKVTVIEENSFCFDSK